MSQTISYLMSYLMSNLILPPMSYLTSDVGYDVDILYRRLLTTISGYFVTYYIIPDMDYDITGMYP
jgi:hypothetical protein